MKIFSITLKTDLQDKFIDLRPHLKQQLTSLIKGLNLNPHFLFRYTKINPT